MTGLTDEQREHNLTALAAVQLTLEGRFDDLNALIASDENPALTSAALVALTAAVLAQLPEDEVAYQLNQWRQTTVNRDDVNE